MEWFLYVLTGLWILSLVLTIVKSIKEKRLFRYDEVKNPFRRYCKKCGQCQVMYSRSYNPHITWWEEVYPLGKDENCKCKNYISDEKW